jgi:hypothetical protein
MSVSVRVIKNKADIDHKVWEGEVSMSEAEKDVYKGIIGDGNASVTVGRELSELDFGNGGKAFLSITLTCDQSSDGISHAAAMAHHLVGHFLNQHFSDLRDRCVAMRLLKAR